MDGPTDSTSFPLFPGQLAIWLDATFLPEKATDYNLGVSWEIVGEMDPSHFHQAVAHLVSETPALRLHLSGSDPTSPPVQCVREPQTGEYGPTIDFADDEHPPIRARQWMMDDLEVPIDLSGFPLFRVALLKLAPDWYYGYMVFHHLAVDGISLRILQARLAEALDAIAAEAPPVKRRMEKAHEAYLAAVRDQESSAGFAAAKQYWQNLHRDPAPRVSLSTRTTSGERAREAIQASLTLSAEEVGSIGATAQRAEVSVTEFLIASVVLFLHRLTGAEDIPLGLPVHGRPPGLRQDFVWMCMNVLPLRFRFDRELEFGELVRTIAAQLREALKHQSYRYESIRRDLGRLGGPGLFATSVNVVRAGSAGSRDKRSELHTTSWVLSPGPLEDMSILIADGLNGDTLYIELRGNSALYEQWELNRHAQNFGALLRALAQLGRTDESDVGAPSPALEDVA